MILGVPYDKIPKFYEDEEVFYERYDKWLAELGYKRVWFDAIRDKDGVFHFPCVAKGVGALRYIAELKNDENKYSHAVVVEIEYNNIKISDPHNWKSYTGIEDLIGFELIIKI